MMKPYIVFAGHHYYPSGGAEDVHAVTDTLEEARQILAKAVEVPGYYDPSAPDYDHNDACTWGHILDCTLAQILYIDFDTGEIENETRPVHELTSA